MTKFYKNLARISVISLFVILSPDFMFSQSVNLYLVKENIETVTSNSGLIISDPLNISNQYGSGDKPAETINKADLNFESDITPTSKYLTLPLGYSWKKFSLSCSIPYYLKRGMTYTHGTESTSGLGDLSINTAFKSKQEKLNSEFHLIIKLPTGNENKQVNGYLVPLGTGSTDVLGHAVLTYTNNKGQVYGNLAFRLNGKLDRVAQIIYPGNEGTETLKYHIKNGNTFMLNTNYSYKFWQYATAVAGISVAANGKGKIDRDQSNTGFQTDTTYHGLTANQNFIMADLNPALVFSFYRFNLSIGCRVPIYTKLNESNCEADRKVAYSIRFSCSIF